MMYLPMSKCVNFDICSPMSDHQCAYRRIWPRIYRTIVTVGSGNLPIFTFISHICVSSPQICLNSSLYFFQPAFCPQVCLKPTGNVSTPTYILCECYSALVYIRQFICFDICPFRYLPSYVSIFRYLASCMSTHRWINDINVFFMYVWSV